MTSITVFKGDKQYDINFNLQDANGNVIDITGATLVLKAQKEGKVALKFSGAMSILSGPAGTCKYTVQATDFDDIGRYYAEIEITFTDGKIITLGDIVINCVSDLPK